MIAIMDFEIIEKQALSLNAQQRARQGNRQWRSSPGVGR
jgi:hypothetical protein